MRLIEINVVGRGRAVAELDEGNPRIAGKLYDILPLEARANLWGDEVYFDIPLEAEDENTCPTSEPGDVCYWSPSPAFCIFFGETQPYSAVNRLGRIVEGLEIFKNVEAGDRIILNRK